MTGNAASAEASARGVKRPLPRGFTLRLVRQLATELAPLLIFFVVFLWYGLMVATAAYAVATLVAFAVAWHAHRRLPILPMVSTVLVLIFAGLSIVLDNAVFIKIKPTVINGFYGSVLVIGWLFGLRLVDRVLRPECTLSEPALRTLTFRTGAYLIALAFLNEAIWRNTSTDTWVLFKVFTIAPLNALFALSQLPLVRRHLIPLTRE